MNKQTFFPLQVGVGFNRDKWEHLERYVRGTTKIYKNVYVCTGPLYLPHAESDGKNYVKYQVIGSNNVAVPTHFFKILVGETADLTLELEAYVLPNKAIPDDTALASFMVSKNRVFFAMYVKDGKPFPYIVCWLLVTIECSQWRFLWSFYPFAFLTCSPIDIRDFRIFLETL